MGRRSYLARRLGRSGVDRTEGHQQALAIVIGLLVIGIVLAMWFAKVAIGSGLRYLTRLQMALLGFAQRRGNRIGYAIERLVAPDHADFRLLIALNMILMGAI